MTRNETIKAIRTALRTRSGKAWSVKGGRGTSYGWITITSPPRRQTVYGYITDEDRVELGELLGVRVHHQGVSIPGQSDFHREYVARAAGLTPAVVGVPQWD